MFLLLFSLLSLCKEINNHIFSVGEDDGHIPLQCHGSLIGLLSPKFASSLLSKFPTVFQAEADRALTFKENLDSSDKRSQAIHSVLGRSFKEGK